MITAPAPRLRRPRRSLGGAVPLSLLACGAGILAALSVAAVPAAPFVPVVLVAAGFALCAAVAWPMHVMCVGLMVVPLEGFFPGLIGPAQAVLGLGAVGWLFAWATRAPVTIPRHPVLIGVVALWVAQAAGLLFAPDPLNVAKQVVTWGTMAIVVVAVAHSARPRDVQNLLLALAVTGGVGGVMAIVDPQSLTGAVFAANDVTRATGGLGSPNILGMLLGVTIPVQLVFILRAPKLWMRTVALGCFSLAMAGMALSVSRGAFIGLAAALLVLAFWAPFRRAAVFVVPLLLVLSIVGHNPASPIGGKVVSRLSEARVTGSSNPRLILWRAAPRMIEDRPVFGMGAFEYGRYASSYGILASEGQLGHAHSLILTVAIESGLVGAGSLLAIFAALALGLGRVIRRASGFEQALAFGLAASFLGFFVNGVLDYGLGAAPIAAIFFVPVGVAVALCRTATTAPVGEPARPRRASSGSAAAEPVRA